MKVYQLSINNDPFGINIVITDQASEYLKTVMTQNPWCCDRLARQFGIGQDSLIPFGKEVFGYNDALKMNGPNVIQANYLGDGKARFVSYSLFVLFKCLNSIERVKSDDDQSRIIPMEINLTLSNDRGGRALGANCSGEFHRWLGGIYGYGTNNTIPPATEAMLAAREILNPGESRRWKSLTMAVMGKMGGFALYCDTQECSMTDGGGPIGSSLQLATHNSDTFEQQLTFLAGLAALAGEYQSSYTDFDRKI